MVKIKEASFVLEDGSIDLDAWLAHLSDKHKYESTSLIRHASILCQLAGSDKATESGESCLQKGLAIAEILADLNLDPEVLAAAIVYESVQFAELSIEDIQEQLGSEVAKLVDGVERMSTIDYIRKSGMQSHTHLDNLRKMLIAMIDDVRVVLIKVAERLRVLRAIASRNDAYRKQIATDIMDIYAPLANRLGLGQIKWELEDLAFRYTKHDTYKEIAKGLKARRVDRDKYVDNIVAILNHDLAEQGLKNFKVYGRSKHIHSIYRKMQRKNIDLDHIYDATAVRVLTENPEECYKVLSIVHDHWRNIPEEFDDYIANPKPNGYRSLHTAVVGPEDRVFEVQIRTFSMHDEAELGVCAHWAYKEGGQIKEASHERKIAWLREVLQWQQELAEGHEDLRDMEQSIVDDRVYIFTPGGDIIDLVKGATPLDFAYAIHTEVGHRCRGAKVNDHIVPLTHELQTGDQVEIMTAKISSPSRDWLNPNANYLKTSRARAKVLHWFKLQDYEQNVIDGKEMFQREIRRLNLDKIDAHDIAEGFNYHKIDDFYAALGRGDLRKTQIISRLSTEIQPKKTPAKSAKPSSDRHVVVEGMGSLMTKFAKCCEPAFGDDIVGYITLGRGISIHRVDCPNMINATHEQQKRMLNVRWGESVSKDYSVNIEISAYDRQGLLNDITACISRDNALLSGVNSSVDDDGLVQMKLGVRVENVTSLAKLLEHLAQVNNVIEAKRSS